MSSAVERNIGGYPSRWICEIEPARDNSGAVIKFLPQSRYKNVRGLPLHKYGAGPFCEFKIPSGLLSSGVYAIFARSELKYIGRCGDNGLSWRFGSSQYGKIQPRNCFKGGQEPNCRINNLIYQEALKNVVIDLWFFETSMYADVEDELIVRFRPPWNLRPSARAR
jgi:hypothetical protein